MHYGGNKLLSLPCCELCWVMSENRSPSDSRRERVSLVFCHLVLNSEPLSARTRCVSPLPRPLSFLSSSFLLFQEFSSFTKSWRGRALVLFLLRSRSFIPTQSHWSLSSLTLDDKVPFAADAQKGQGCRCFFLLHEGLSKDAAIQQPFQQEYPWN